MDYTTEFLTIAAIHFLAVASPGPDFAVTLKQSVSYGRRAGLLTSLGIGMGIFVHVGYCIVGLGVLISHSILLFNVIKYVGAGYLIFIGVSAMRAKPRELSVLTDAPLDQMVGSFLIGFLTNALNPKATIFFLSVFSVVVSPTTPVVVQLAYGVWMAFASTLWFSFLTLFFSLGSVRNFLSRFGHWFDRIMGALLVALGIRLALVPARD